jgi:hypothetical protein
MTDDAHCESALAGRPSRTSGSNWPRLLSSAAGASSSCTPTTASAVPKGRDNRLAFDRMCRDAVAGKFDIIAAWSVHRLGRARMWRQPGRSQVGKLH